MSAIGEEEVRRSVGAAVEFDAAPEDAPREDRETRSNQAGQLLLLAAEAELFHTPAREACAAITANGSIETLRVRDSRFKLWLQRQFFDATGATAGAEPLRAALDQIEATALFEGEPREVHLRVAGGECVIRLDLADAGRRVIRIDRTGWRIENQSSALFRRPQRMRALPLPVTGGSVEQLAEILNLATEDDLVLTAGWLMAALRGSGPYPVLAIGGEQGSAKSSFARAVRALVDPAMAPLRSLPRSERDLFIAALNSHVMAFDNVSTIPDWLSDSFCSLATGAGFATRKLHTDSDEIIIEAARPIILNGIGAFMTRPDLADRALFMRLAQIPDHLRETERALEERFEAARGRILGALLDGVATGLARLGDIRLDAPPRMADFAEWATACETAFWPEGAFMAAHDRKRAALVEETLDADPVAVALRGFILRRREWSGTATQLLGALAASVDVEFQRFGDWPKGPAQLSSRLDRLETFLRRWGLQIERARVGHAAERMIRLRLCRGDAVDAPETSSAASAASAADARRTAPQPAGGAPADDADAADDDLQTSMGKWRARL